MTSETCPGLQTVLLQVEWGSSTLLGTAEDNLRCNTSTS